MSASTAEEILYGLHSREHADTIDPQYHLIPAMLMTEDQQRVFIRADLADTALEAKHIAGQMLDLKQEELFSNERESLKQIPGLEDWEPTPVGQSAGKLFWHLLILNPESLTDEDTKPGPFKQFVVYPEPPPRK